MGLVQVLNRDAAAAFKHVVEALGGGVAGQQRRRHRPAGVGKLFEYHQVGEGELPAEQRFERPAATQVVDQVAQTAQVHRVLGQPAAAPRPHCDVEGIVGGK